jgi:hypothetical protein
VTFLGVPAGTATAVDGGPADVTAGEGRASVTVRAAPGTAVRVGCGEDGPRTQDRSDRLFDVLNTAQFGHSAKASAWTTLTADLTPGAMLVELHAQGLPRALIGAIAEVLTAVA